MPGGLRRNPLGFRGRIKQFLKNRINSKSPRNLRLWWGYLHGIKRGCAPLEHVHIREALEAHRAALSEPAPDVDEDLMGIYEDYFERFYARFKSPTFRFHEASSGSSLRSKRSEGGSYGLIRDSLILGYLRPDRLTSGELLSLAVGGDYFLGLVELTIGEPIELRGFPLPSVEEVLKLGRETPVAVRVAPLVEPLKVRIISAGNAPNYYYSRSYQKHLWGYLQTKPQFSLTGCPLVQGALHDTLTRERALGEDLFSGEIGWVSGDYTAATDHLNLNFTRACFEESLAHCPSLSLEEMTALRAVIYEQELQYPPKYGLDHALQQDGQLMGSVLSFPILCIINLVCYWRALELHTGRTFAPHELPCLINGDDILFRADQAFYEVWQEVVKEVGFTLSVGKNYWHRKHFTVNSLLFTQKTDPDGRVSFAETPYLNTGLLIRDGVSVGRTADKSLPLPEMYNVVVAGASDPVRAHRRFLHYHLRDVKRLSTRGTTTFNLFSAPERGGLGFVNPRLSEMDVSFTPFQRRFATFLEQEYKRDIKSDVPPRIHVGLVTKPSECRPVISVPRTGLLGISSATGPLPEGDQYFVEESYPLPPLMCPYNNDPDTQFIRLPSRKLIERFRSRHCRELSQGRMLTWPYRTVVRSATRPDNPFPESHVSVQPFGVCMPTVAQILEEVKV